MSTIKQLRDGLGTALATIPKLRVHSVTPDDPHTPFAVIDLPRPITYDVAMGRGLDEYEFVVVVAVGGASTRIQQDALMAFMDSSGSSSVKEAIHTNRTLGGAASDSRVSTMRDRGPLVVGQNQFLAAEFVVTVYA